MRAIMATCGVRSSIGDGLLDKPQLENILRRHNLKLTTLWKRTCAEDLRANRSKNGLSMIQPEDWLATSGPNSIASLRFNAGWKARNYYLALGGPLDPEPDMQSPFFDA